MDWLKEVAAFAKKSASKNEGRDKFLEFASSLPENQHRFAIEKFDHYEKVFAKERAYAPIQSMVMRAAKTLSRDKFDVLLNDVPQEFRSAAARTYHHYRCIFGQRRKINEHACDEFPKMKRRAEYVRVGTLSLEFVFANMGKIVEINELGVFANCDSWRIKAYASKGVTCAHCGISGTFFAIEHYECQPKGSSHLNLYHVTDDGSETMITVDHVIPKSKGGTEEQGNLQPLCKPCNGRKGNLDEASARRMAKAE